MTVPPALRLEHLAVHYGDHAAVSEVTLTLEPGQWLAVIGPNGAGKSTVLRAIVGVAPFSGRLEFAGAAVEPGQGRAGRWRGRSPTIPSGASRRVAYMPQHPVLPEGMTTAEYVLLGRTAHLGLLRSESAGDRRRVAEVLDELDLGEEAGRPMSELSGGEAQRATLARALLQEASILVLDEPTSALDLGHQIAVLELIDRLRHEHGLAVVTALHDLTVAGRFADRLLLLSGGSPVASGTPAEVLTEDVLSRYYRTPVSILEGPGGTAVVVPLRDRELGHTGSRTDPDPDRINDQGAAR